jgi:hypothetical protein
MGLIMSDIASEIRLRLLALPGCGAEDFEGASRQEIQELEVYAGGQLPSIYKQFLKLCGRSAKELFRGSNYSVSQRFGFASESMRRNSWFEARRPSHGRRLHLSFS